ncbi:MAG TPA: sodium/solute symporter [Thermoguttaceae bacterium]|nr:sodium/solute symporter [Thermoguttaceae bacterium]
MGFSFWDYLVLGVYLAGIVLLGAWFARRQSSTDEYFLGGRRFHWFPVAVSMFASLFSATSYVAAPGEAFNHGMTLFLKSAAVLLGVPLAVILFVRFFRRLSLTTAYEYLERRFNLQVRLMASFLFLLLRSFWLGVTLFASAVALEPATHWPIGVGVVVVGVVATLCATLGGMKSVIWIEVIQFVILCGGILLVIATLTWGPSQSLLGIWQYAGQRDHAFGQLAESSFYSFDPFVRYSLWAIVISAIFTKLTLAGADQISIQRYLSTRNEKDASRSLVWGTALGVPVMFLLYYCGLGLLWFYETHPERALPGMTGDTALPHYIATELPAGMGGVLIAAILAAAMNTVNSGVNSLATCSVTDFYGRVLRPEASQARKVAVARVLTVVWGGLAIASAALMIWLYGGDRGQNPLIFVSEVTLGLFGGILLGIFLLGILSRRATSFGVLVGAVVGLAAALAITAPYYFRQLPPDAPRLSFLWINIVGCLVTVAVGYAASYLSPRPRPEQIAGNTYWGPATIDTVNL